MNTTKLLSFDGITIKAVILKRRKHNSIVTFSDDLGLSGYVEVDKFLHALDKLLIQKSIHLTDFSARIMNDAVFELSVGGTLYVKHFSTPQELTTCIMNTYATLSNLLAPIKQTQYATIRAAVE